MKKLYIIACFILITAVSGVSLCYADVPLKLNYQGKLTDNSGNIVNDGSYTLKFCLYDADTGGNSIWCSSGSAVTVKSGVFSTVLDLTTGLTGSPDFNKSYYLEVTVNAQVLSPRQPVLVSMYAINADRLDGKDSVDFAVKTHTHTEYLPVAGGTLTGKLTVPDFAITATTEITSLNANFLQGKSFNALTGLFAGSTHTHAGTGGGSVSPATTITSLDGTNKAVGTQTSVYALGDHKHKISALPDTLITGTKWSTLTGGSTSNADTLHTHSVSISDAQSVDGFSASSTPTASTLLALDASAKFPASVLPAITNAEISDGTIKNADIAADAAIAKSKLGALNIGDGDVSLISASKISTTGATNIVTKIIAGANVGITPSTGVGEVTISATGGGGGSVTFSNTVANLDGTSSTGTILEASKSDHKHGIANGVITSAMLKDGDIVDADISGSASISDSKLATISSAGKVADTALSNNVTKLGQTIESAEITDGTITDADISAISASKLTGVVVTSPSSSQTIAASAATVTPLQLKMAASQTASPLVIQDSAGTTKFAVDTTGAITTGIIPYSSVTGKAVTSSDITDVTIVDADISSSANISDTKLATISAAGKVSDSALSNTVTKLGQTIESSEITDGTITATDIFTNIVSSVDGVTNDGGNIDLVAGSGITITPDDTNNQITISASGGSGTVTQVSTGSGLTGGPITTTGTISVATGGITDTMLAGSISASKISGTAWTSTNDGSGTGLDADLLDGSSSSSFASSSHTHNYDSSYVNVGGDTMTGTLTVSSSSNINALYVSSAANAPNYTVYIRNTATTGPATRVGLVVKSDTSTAASFESGGAASPAISAFGPTGNSDYVLQIVGYGTISGNLTVNGTLSKGSGSFLIDHPLNPTEQVLRHSFVESPDMKNVYDGIVELDENGEALVELPEYFETLNVKFRYQLTSVGGYAPLYVKQEISGNQFVIASANNSKDAGLKVSWQVTGVRNDPYAQVHPIVVEEEKGTGNASDFKKGELIHKDAYETYFAKQKEKEKKKLVKEK